jgi:hypothetical protein
MVTRKFETVRMAGTLADRNFPPTLVARFRHGDTRLALFSMIAIMGTPVDASFQNLRLELFFPGDDATAKWFAQAAKSNEPDACCASGKNRINFLRYTTVDGLKSLTTKSVYDGQQCSPTLQIEAGKNPDQGLQASRSRSSSRLTPRGVFAKGANMTRGSVNKLDGAARPIKTKKDYSGAASVIEKISGKPDPETVAEKRLQSLLKEMEKFDGDGDDPDEEAPDGGYAGPLRRWSDESTDTD